MSEWTTHIETPHGTTSQVEDLERFHEALLRQPEALGAAAGMNTETGALGATFTVEADSPQEALQVGMAAFERALEQAGLPAGNWGKLEIEPAEDHEAVYA